MQSFHRYVITPCGRTFNYGGNEQEALDQAREKDAAAARRNATGCPPLLCKVGTASLHLNCWCVCLRVPAWHRLQESARLGTSTCSETPCEYMHSSTIVVLMLISEPVGVIHAIHAIQMRPASTAACNVYNNVTGNIAPGSVQIGA